MSCLIYEQCRSLVKLSTNRYVNKLSTPSYMSERALFIIFCDTFVKAKPDRVRITLVTDIVKVLLLF
jgi:hypothetical protein